MEQPSRQPGASPNERHAVEVRRPPIYDQLAEAIRAEILAGKYDPTEADPTANEMPGAVELGPQYGVSDKTAAWAIQRLVADGLVRARSGLRAIVAPESERTQTWPMHRRYARAREAGGLVFGGDLHGQDVEKRITGAGWAEAPPGVATLLRLEPEAQVWARQRRTLVGGQVAETSVSYFPTSVTEQVPGLMATGPFPPGGVVGVLEGAGCRILRTYNEVRARLATEAELDAFGVDPALAPLRGRAVIAITHATYGAGDQPLEAVMSARPANDAVVAFQTYEGPDDGRPHDPSIAEKRP